MEGIDSVGMVELVHIGKMLRLGCHSLLMPACGYVGGGKPLQEQNGLLLEHSAESQQGVGKAETKFLI